MVSGETCPSHKELRSAFTTVSNDILKPHYGTFVAVVDCLCTKSMTEEAVKYEEQQRKGVTYYRSQHYDDTLQLLRRIIGDANKGIIGSRQGLSVAIRAGLISRWLAKYPWGGLDTCKDERIEVRL